MHQPIRSTAICLYVLNCLANVSPPLGLRDPVLGRERYRTGSVLHAQERQYQPAYLLRHGPVRSRFTTCLKTQPLDTFMFCSCYVDDCVSELDLDDIC